MTGCLGKMIRFLFPGCGIFVSPWRVYFQLISWNCTILKPHLVFVFFLGGVICLKDPTMGFITMKNIHHLGWPCFNLFPTIQDANLGHSKPSSKPSSSHTEREDQCEFGPPHLGVKVDPCFLRFSRSVLTGRLFGIVLVKFYRDLTVDQKTQKVAFRFREI